MTEDVTYENGVSLGPVVFAWFASVPNLPIERTITAAMRHMHRVGQKTGPQTHDMTIILSNLNRFTIFSTERFLGKFAC